MGACCGKLNKSLKLVKGFIIINEMKKEKEFAYLQPKEKLYCLKDVDFNVLLLDIKLEGWNSTQVQL